MNKYPSNDYSYTDPPLTSKDWIECNEEERKNILKIQLKKNLLYRDFEVVEADQNGFVTLKTEKLISADKRGVLLLDIEDMLKKTVDVGVTVWLKAAGDKSKLRNLRGIEIKTQQKVNNASN